MNRRILVFGLVLLLLGTACITTASFYVDNPLPFASVAALVAAAATVTGGLAGFIFGIPHIAAQRSTADPSWSIRYSANTNLEQVSDWLTKIIIGIGLTQIPAIGRWLHGLLNVVAPALGDGQVIEVFAGALLTYFSIGGFIVGWLATRISLGPALTATDKKALDQFVQAEIADIRGDKDSAEMHRQNAVNALREAHDVAGEYEALRREQPTSSRFAGMEALMTVARAAAGTRAWTPDEVRSLFEEGNGSRIFAIGLMQGSPVVSDVSCIIDAIVNSHSAFEQYHALTAAESVADHLSADDRARLREAIEGEMAPDRHIHPGTARRRIAERVVARLG